MEPRLQRLLSKRIGPELELAPGLRPVLADPLGFEEIVLNLATHVRASTPAVGTLRLITSAATLSEADCAAHPDARAGEYVLLSVSQVSDEPALPALAYLFEPLPATTGNQGNMALTAAEGMVHQLGGFLLVAQGGTRWDVYLPAQMDQPPETAPEPAAAPAPVEATPEAGEPNWPAAMAEAAAASPRNEPAAEVPRSDSTAEPSPAAAPAPEAEPAADAAASKATVREAGPAVGSAEMIGAAPGGEPAPAQTVEPEPLPETAGVAAAEPAPEVPAPTTESAATASAENEHELPAFLSEEDVPSPLETEPPGGIGARLRARLRRKAAPQQDAAAEEPAAPRN